MMRACVRRLFYFFLLSFLCFFFLVFRLALLRPSDRGAGKGAEQRAGRRGAKEGEHTKTEAEAVHEDHGDGREKTRTHTAQNIQIDGRMDQR